MRAEQARCGHCGAALPLSAGTIVVCAYCGRESRLVGPPPAPSPPRHPPGAATKPGSSLLWIVLGSAAALTMVAVALVLGLGVRAAVTPPRSSGPAAPATPTDLRAPRFWHTRDVALLRGTNSAAVAGIVSLMDGSTRLAVLEGETGRMRWQAPAHNGIDVYADGGEVLLTFDPVKKITRHDVQTGQVRWSVTVAGPVHDITFGESCAAILIAGEPLGIETGSGRLAPCKPATAPRPGRYKLETSDAVLKRGELEIVGGLELDRAPVNPAPPRFAISASRGGSAAWRVVPTSLEPVWTSDGFHRSVTLTPAGVFVFGRDAATHTARWLLLDADRGRLLYERASAAKVEGRLHVVAGGALVFVSYDRALDVIRAADGVLAWRLGS